MVNGRSTCERIFGRGAGHAIDAGQARRRLHAPESRQARCPGPAGAHRAWASGLGLDEAAVQSLRELAEAMNYNAYGASESDLLLPPARLYERVRPYRNPFDFVEGEPLAKELAARRQVDLVSAEGSLHEPGPADALRQGNALRGLEVKRLCEASAIDQCTDDRRQASRCAVEIDVLDDAT